MAKVIVKKNMWWLKSLNQAFCRHKRFYECLKSARDPQRNKCEHIHAYLYIASDKHRLVHLQDQGFILPHSTHE